MNNELIVLLEQIKSRIETCFETSDPEMAKKAVLGFLENLIKDNGILK